MGRNNKFRYEPVDFEDDVDEVLLEKEINEALGPSLGRAKSKRKCSYCLKICFLLSVFLTIMGSATIIVLWKFGIVEFTNYGLFKILPNYHSNATSLYNNRTQEDELNDWNSTTLSSYSNNSSAFYESSFPTNSSSIQGNKFPMHNMSGKFHPMMKDGNQTKMFTTQTRTTQKRDFNKVTPETTNEEMNLDKTQDKDATKLDSIKRKMKEIGDYFAQDHVIVITAISSVTIFFVVLIFGLICRRTCYKKRLKRQQIKKLVNDLNGGGAMEKFSMIDSEDDLSE